MLKTSPGGTISGRLIFSLLEGEALMFRAKGHFLDLYNCLSKGKDKVHFEHLEQKHNLCQSETKRQ